MERKRIKFTLWALAIVITLAAAYYQRATGPNHPDYEKVTLNGKDYRLKLIRSATTDRDCIIHLKITDPATKGSIFYKRYPTHDDWTELQFIPDADGLRAQLPIQPTAGKLAYYIALNDGDGVQTLRQDDPVIIRFNDAVPNYILIPHITFMFLSMLLAAMVLLLVFTKNGAFRPYLFLAFAIFTLGGMVLGPFVQKFAFGEFWTGVPFGWDLTDNKTLIAWVFFLIAVIANYRKQRSIWAVIAVVIMFLVYLIPHSMFGSELDPNTGEIISA